MWYSIGDLARRTGLTVKTIRYYSDQGIVPAAGRTSAGYRRYDIEAVARLQLVRTLRDLGLDLATIRRVVDREISLAEVAAAHADALAVQIRVLRLRQAILRAVAKRGSVPEEMGLMHRLAKLSEDERRRLVDDFLGAVFADVEAGIVRTATPELPDDPDPDQIEAWVELAELTQDPEFRASTRRMAERYAAGARTGQVPRRDAVAIVRDQVAPALAAGLDPAAPEAKAVVADVMGRYARTVGQPDSVELRRELVGYLQAASDPRWYRYLDLLSVINGWSPPENPAPALGWFIRALAC
jgi:DNA-binding transcriptional MerR regulator